MLARRKNICSICQRVGEMVQQDLCRPCYRSRKCDSCGAVNRAMDAGLCLKCFQTRRGLGSAQARLVVWCTICYSAADRASMLCSVCLRSGPPRICHHCGTDEHVLEDVFRCSTLECDMRIRFCANCVCLGRAATMVQCKTCWHATGKLCMVCQAQPGRNALKWLRYCQACAKDVFCEACTPQRPPPATGAQAMPHVPPQSVVVQRTVQGGGIDGWTLP